MVNEIDDPNQEFEDAVIRLLESGDADGCDGLIVVDLENYREVQRLLKKKHGTTFGESTDEDPDIPF